MCAEVDWLWCKWGVLLTCSPLIMSTGWMDDAIVTVSSSSTYNSALDWTKSGAWLEYGK